METLIQNIRKPLLCAALGIIALLPAVAWTAGEKGTKYPTKPIELIVAFSPGGGTDTIARVVAALATKKFGVPVNVVNVTGASGVTGTLRALNATPDGRTLLMDGNVTSSFMLATHTDLPIKLEDRTFLARAATDYAYFFCNVNTGWKTLEDALQVARTQPNEFTWGAGAYGSTPMFAEVDLFIAAGLDMNKIKQTKMVVFEKGNAPSKQACVSGDVQFAVTMTKGLASMLATKRVRALAVNAPKRTKEYPDIPTTKELGYPEADLTPWYGISGPKGLPDYVINAWEDLLSGADSDSEAKAAAAKMQKTWAFLPSGAFRAYVLKQYEQMIPVATDLGLRK